MENIVGKGENPGNQQFFFLSHFSFLSEADFMIFSNVKFDLCENSEIGYVQNLSLV